MPRHGPSPSLSTPSTARRKTLDPEATPVLTRFPLEAHSNFRVITHRPCPTSSLLDNDKGTMQNGNRRDGGVLEVNRQRTL